MTYVLSRNSWKGLLILRLWRELYYRYGGQSRVVILNILGGMTCI
ncbi:hypothetical protein Goari_024049 [Gossypium aridum]|uniref:Uncharacterized protein n=1 Tax=Gossypium aridum TaxID=34290 RepID=A0A7J8X533_GOSAI|nr:hypothetical protein [Gossypium aridum]